MSDKFNQYKSVRKQNGNNLKSRRSFYLLTGDTFNRLRDYLHFFLEDVVPIFKTKEAKVDSRTLLWLEEAQDKLDSLSRWNAFNER